MTGAGRKRVSAANSTVVVGGPFYLVRKDFLKKNFRVLLYIMMEEVEGLPDLINKMNCHDSQLNNGTILSLYILYTCIDKKKS